MKSCDEYLERLRFAGRQVVCAARDEPTEVVTACGASIAGRAVVSWQVEPVVEVTCPGCLTGLGVA